MISLPSSPPSKPPELCATDLRIMQKSRHVGCFSLPNLRGPLPRVICLEPQHMPCDSDTTATITSNGKTRILNEKGRNERKKRLLWFHGRSVQQGWAPGGKETTGSGRRDWIGAGRGAHLAFRIRRAGFPFSSAVRRAVRRWRAPFAQTSRSSHQEKWALLTCVGRSGSVFLLVRPTSMGNGGGEGSGNGGALCCDGSHRTGSAASFSLRRASHGAGPSAELLLIFGAVSEKCDCERKIEMGGAIIGAAVDPRSKSKYPVWDFPVVSSYCVRDGVS